VEDDIHHRAKNLQAGVKVNEPSFRNLFIKKLTLPSQRSSNALSSPEQAIEGLAGPRIVSAALGRGRLEHAELALLFDCVCVVELELYKRYRNL